MGIYDRIRRATPFARYVARRILIAVPVVLGVTFITFSIAWLANDGDLSKAYVTDKMTPLQRQEIVRRYGFDQPFLVQYLGYLQRLVHLDLGLSHSDGDRPIAAALAQYFPPTAELTIAATLLAVVVGVAVGMLSAVRKDRPVDQVARFLALSGVSLPIFWLGLILKYFLATPFGEQSIEDMGSAALFAFVALVFAAIAGLVLVGVDFAGVRVRKGVQRAVWGGVLVAAALVAFAGLAPAVVHATFAAAPRFPLGDQKSSDLLDDPNAHPSLTRGPTGLLLVDTALAGDSVAFFDVLWHHALPALTLAYATMAIITRMMRASMLEVLNQDFVRTARAKGLPEAQVRRRHARRNALLPTVTVVGLGFGSLLGGAVLTETVWQWPGMGRWSTNAIGAYDTNSVLAFTVLVTLAYVLVNLVVDILYGFLDPRVRLG